MPSSSAALSMSRSTRGAKVIFTRTGFSGWGSTGTSWYKVPSGTSISSSRQCASAFALAAARPEGTGRGVPRSASTSSQPVAASWCRFEGFLQRVAEGVAAFQIREEYAERAVFLRQKLCDVVVSHTHLEYMGLAGAFAPSRGLTKFQAALLLDALEGGERDFLFRVGNRGLSGLRGVPEVPVASGRPGDNLNPTILFQPLDDLFARHPVPPWFRCVLNTHLGRICQAFDVYFVCI